LRKLLSILILLLFIPSVLAITGEIGNARVVISKDWDGKETIERTILVRNSNDVPLTIRLEASEGLEDIVELIDEEFTLPAGTEKKARFDLVFKRPGSWNGKINVFFIPEEGSRVVLSSTMIINLKTDEKVELPPEDDIGIDVGEVKDDDEAMDDTKEDTEVSPIVGFGIKGSKEKESNLGSVLAVLTILLVVIVVVSGVIYLLKK